MNNLENKIAIVTGANSGMGMATVAALSDMGATVVMLCRNKERAESALKKLLIKKDRKIDLILCDLGKFDSIINFVNIFKSKYNKLDLLINNAGFISLDRQETAEGIERQFGINHIGHFLLTIKLVNMMNSGSRIINVASGAHKIGKIHFDDINLTRGFNVFKAYSQSKLANVLFTKELALRLKNKQITVNCCHPGAVATNMGVDRETGFGKTVTRILKPFFQTPEQGAKTAIYLASNEAVSNISGEYFYNCKISKSSKLTHNKALAKQLFELSEKIVGCTYND